MVYLEFFAPSKNAYGGYNNIVPRPDKWTREELFGNLFQFLGDEIGGDKLGFILKPGRHLANEAKGLPETMEDGYFLINPKTQRVMAFMSDGAYDLYTSEKTVINDGKTKEVDHKAIASDIQKRYYGGEFEQLSKTYKTPEDDVVFIYYNCGQTFGGKPISCKPKNGETWNLDNLLFGLFKQFGIAPEKVMTGEIFIICDDNATFFATAGEDGKPVPLASVSNELSKQLIVEFANKHPEALEPIDKDGSN